MKIILILTVQMIEINTTTANGKIIFIIYANLVMPRQEKNCFKINMEGKRLKYLKRTQKADYTIVLIDGTLNTHLKELQETANGRVQKRL